MGGTQHRAVIITARDLSHRANPMTLKMLMTAIIQPMGVLAET